MREIMKEQTWDWKTLLAPAAGPLPSRQERCDGSCFSTASKSRAEWNGMHRLSPQTVWPLSIFFSPGFVQRHLISTVFFFILNSKCGHLEGFKSFIHWSDCETRRWVLKHLRSLPDRRPVITQLQGGVAASSQVARLFFTFDLLLAR